MNSMHSPDRNGAELADGNPSGSASGPGAATTGHVVVFRIGHQAYGLPVADVREVILLPLLLTVPGISALCSGFLNWHGQYLPVLSGHRLIDVPETIGIDSQIVICGQAPFALGLLIDQVVDVRFVTSGDRALLKQHDGALVHGIAQSHADTIVIFHAPAVYALGAQFAIHAPG